MKKLIAIALVFFCTNAVAAETKIFKIAIENHKFIPDELEVPTGEKFKLVVENKDKTPEEFESHSLKREKIIGANSTATIYLGPLEPGIYDFFGEFNPQNAKGKLIAK